MQAMKTTSLVGACVVVTTDSRHARAVEDPIDVDVKVLEVEEIPKTRSIEIQRPRFRCGDRFRFLHFSQIIQALKDS